jgi:hypothetical protein
MCGDAGESSVVGMTTTSHSNRTIVVLAACVAAALCIAALLPAAGHAAGRTQTLKVFSKMVSMSVTHADGTVQTKPPFAEPQPGDVLDIYSLDFRGNHKRHSKHFVGSDHLRCVFGAGEPECVSHVALGGSLLIIEGNPGTIVAGTGRFQGATGRVLSSKEVPGGTDAVAKIKLAKHHP